MTPEYVSNNPGEPPTHLTAFKHKRSQKKRKKSPGNTIDKGKLKMLNCKEYAERSKISLSIIPICDKSTIETTMINVASI
jgi:hypothetical protein